MVTAPAVDPATANLSAPSGPRRLLAQVERSEPTSLAEHRRHFGRPSTPGRARSDIIRVVTDAGLRGRGGAGFPTGVKLRAVADGRGRPVVVVNGTEGEPASRKDATILRLQPHLVLDGAAWAAAAVGASEVYVCVERAQRAVRESLAAALRERDWAEQGVPMTLLATPPRYVAGEETALVNWINGGDARPTATPPRPFERGVHGRPTLVDNAETLAHLAQIVQYGPTWFRSMGIESAPGTALLTVSGAVAREAVYEVPIGVPLAEVLSQCGAPERIGAVLVGGYFGSWLAPHVAGTIRLCDEDLRPRGGGFGCGAVVVLPADACGVVESARVMRWMAAETAGQCGACVNGLHAIAGCLSDVARGSGGRASIDQLHRWAGMVEGRGACRFPDGAVRFLRSALEVFADDIAHHASGLACGREHRDPVLPVPAVAQVWR